MLSVEDMSQIPPDISIATSAKLNISIKGVENRGVTSIPSDTDKLNSLIAKAALKILMRDTCTSSTPLLQGKSSCITDRTIEEEILACQTSRFDTFYVDVASIAAPAAPSMLSYHCSRKRLWGGEAGLLSETGLGTVAVNDANRSKLVPVVMDIAHNESAMISLVEKLRSVFPNRKFRYIFLPFH